MVTKTWSLTWELIREGHLVLTKKHIVIFQKQFEVILEETSKKMVLHLTRQILL